MTKIFGFRKNRPTTNCPTFGYGSAGDESAVMNSHVR